MARIMSFQMPTSLEVAGLRRTRLLVDAAIVNGDDLTEEDNKELETARAWLDNFLKMVSRG